MDIFEEIIEEYRKSLNFEVGDGIFKVKVKEGFVGVELPDRIHVRMGESPVGGESFVKVMIVVEKGGFKRTYQESFLRADNFSDEFYFSILFDKYIHPFFLTVMSYVHNCRREFFECIRSRIKRESGEYFEYYLGLAYKTLIDEEGKIIKDLQEKEIVLREELIENLKKSEK